MTKSAKVVLSCTDCPFNGQDNIYCRTCPIQPFLYLCSGKEVLFMSIEEKKVKIEQANKLAKWFKISIEISIFGHVIFSKTWPPQD